MRGQMAGVGASPRWTSYLPPMYTVHGRIVIESSELAKDLFVLAPARSAPPQYGTRVLVRVRCGQLPSPSPLSPPTLLAIQTTGATRGTPHERARVSTPRPRASIQSAVGGGGRADETQMQSGICVRSLLVRSLPACMPIPPPLSAVPTDTYTVLTTRTHARIGSDRSPSINHHANHAIHVRNCDAPGKSHSSTCCRSIT